MISGFCHDVNENCTLLAYYVGTSKSFGHFFVCRVLVSVRLLRVGSIVHNILIV